MRMSPSGPKKAVLRRSHSALAQVASSSDHVVSGYATVAISQVPGPMGIYHGAAVKASNVPLLLVKVTGVA
jgi:hypothetical protein